MHSFRIVLRKTSAFKMESIMNLLSRGKESPAKAAFLATVVIASTVALAYNVWGGTESTTKLAPAVSEEEAKLIMNTILKNLKLLAPRLLMAAQNIRQQIQQQGGEIEDEVMMKQYILPHFGSNLKEIQEKILEEFDVDEDELEEAVNTYIANGDEELIGITKSIRVLHTQFGGDSEIEPPKAAKNSKAAEMGFNEVIALLEEMASQMLQETDDFCGKFVDEYGIPTNAQLAQEFQIGMMEMSQK